MKSGWAQGISQFDLIAHRAIVPWSVLLGSSRSQNSLADSEKRSKHMLTEGPGISSTMLTCQDTPQRIPIGSELHPTFISRFSEEHIRMIQLWRMITNSDHYVAPHIAIYDSTSDETGVTQV